MGKHRTRVKPMDASFNGATLFEKLNEWRYCIRASLMDLAEYQNTGCIPNPEENLNFKNPTDFLNNLEKVQIILGSFMDSFANTSDARERSKYGVYPAIVAGLQMEAHHCYVKTKNYIARAS